MDLLKILSEWLVECGCDVRRIDIKRKCVTFYKPYQKTRWATRTNKYWSFYKLSISNQKLLIYRADISSAENSADHTPYFGTNQRLLLSLDIHDPESLRHIRTWIQDK